MRREVRLLGDAEWGDLIAIARSYADDRAVEVAQAFTVAVAADPGLLLLTFNGVAAGLRNTG